MKRYPKPEWQKEHSTIPKPLAEKARAEWVHRVDTHESGKYEVLHFRSPREYIQECLRLDMGGDTSGSDEWTYGSAKCRSRTIEYALEGRVSDELAAMSEDVEKVVKQLVFGKLDAKASAKPHRNYSYAGGNVDYGRYFSGQPDCLRKIRQGQRKRTVRLGIKGNLSAGNSEQEFVKLVALGSGIAKALEDVGFATEILGYIGATDYQSKHFTTAMPLKKAGERYDIQKIASLSLTGLFRDFAFGIYDVWAKTSDFQIGRSDGYGRSCSSSEEMLDMLQVTANIETSWTSRGRQETVIESILDKAGVL